MRTLSLETGRFECDGESRYSPLEEPDASAFLAEERNQLDVAFDGHRPVGMLLAYELARRDGPRRILFVYELGVDVGCRRRGIGRELLRRAAARARDPGITRGFLTDEGNTAALALYQSEGAVREHDDDVVLDFDFGSGS